MPRRLLALLLVLVALLSACGDSKKSSTPGESSKGGARTEAELKALLLTQADVPAGLVIEEQAEEEEEEESDEDSDCLTQDVDDVVPSAAEATAEFASEDGIRQVTQELSSYETGKATQAMAEGRRQLEKCRTFEAAVEESTLKGTLAEATFPNLGDETLGFVLQATIAGVAVNGEFVVVRKGESVTMLTNLVAGGAVDRTVTLTLAQKAVAKLG